MSEMNAAPHQTPAVLCQGIKKSFAIGNGKEIALRDVNLAVKQGELMMLVGPSGCGKTTLISIIAGILHADEGACSVLNVNYGAISQTDIVRFRGRNVGFIFQDFNLLPVLSVGLNVAIPLIVNGEKNETALERARTILDEVELGNRFDSLPTELSGGQQQRVAIARALIHNPPLLVCDEPTSALDQATGEKIMELLRRTVYARGTTAIVVTHDNRILDYADRIARMNDGVITDIVEVPPPSPPEDEERMDEQ